MYPSYDLNFIFYPLCIQMGGFMYILSPLYNVHVYYPLCIMYILSPLYNVHVYYPLCIMYILSPLYNVHIIPSV